MRTIKLFTHTDLDGIGCAIVALKAFGDRVDIEYCDYDNINDRVAAFLDSDNSEYLRVFITDISVNETIAARIDSELSTKEVALLDHHKTADWLNCYEWAFVETESVVGIKRSGTDMLCVEIGLFLASRELEDFVSKVRRYDTWEWSTKYNDVHAKEINDLFYIIGRDRFVQRFTANPSIEFTDAERLLLDLERDKIDAYKTSKLRDVVFREIGGYRVGIVFAERYHSELGNYLAIKCADTDFIALINPSKSVSYRGVDKTDVGLFAKERGGGGHRNAAGSPITEAMKSRIIDAIFGGVDE